MSVPVFTETTVIDLTHVLRPGMPVYPGTEPPEFLVPCTIAVDGFTEKKLTLYSHTGTHMDAPAHILEGAPTLDRLPAARFVGSAVVLDLSHLGKPEISLADLAPFAPRIAGKEFLILHTGWSDLWGDPAYFEGYPVLSMEAAQWIATLGLKGLGVDMISIDGPDTTEFPVHRIILGAGMVAVENLTALRQVGEEALTFCCFPLKIEQADGSPVRAIALL